MTLAAKMGWVAFMAFLLGAAFAWYEIPTVTVTVMPPASIRAPGPELWDQPADEQAIEILASSPKPYVRPQRRLHAS